MNYYVYALQTTEAAAFCYGGYKEPGCSASDNA